MKKRRSSIENRQAMHGRLFILPFTIGFLYFFLRAAIQSLSFVFSNVKLKLGGFDMEFVGLKNLQYIFARDPDFNKNLVSAMTSLLYKVPVVIIASLFFAMLLNAKF
ncbi:MAG: sugar ABC transporter permease, partial [Clostridia bacterium]|nr:sugar ABC transporter permease [Clostridia bacterium]